jgi:pimeloyl-ACP methyl ester carboxylesterase
MAEDALAVLDAAEVERADVYGISLGGVLALELASSAPERVRSLVLGCTCVLTPDKPRAPMEVNDALLAATRRNLADSTLYGSVCPPEARARNHRAILEDSAVPQALVAQQDALRAYEADLSDVAALTMPALVLHGTEDPVVPVEWGRELAATLPHSRLVVYEGCGHNYLVEVGDAPTREVLGFLAELDAAQPVKAL